MGIELDKLVGNQPGDPAAGYDRQAGTYKDQVHDIPSADLTQESSMPEAPQPNPFTLGPLGK